MPRALEIALAVLAILLLGAGGFATFAYTQTSAALEKTYKAPTTKITLPGDQASIAEGKRLLIARGCTECHGEDLGGKSMAMGPVGTFWGTPPDLLWDLEGVEQ